MIRHYLFCAMALICYCVGYADTTCLISQTGDTVEVLSAMLEGDNAVSVSLGNDSNITSANISVTVEVDYGGNYKKQYSGKTQVGPMQTKSLNIPIDSSYKDRSPKSVSVISITGSKCLN